MGRITFDALPGGSSAVADLGSVSYELLFHVAREFMASRRPVLVESNFSRARHAGQLRALVAGSAYRLVEVHCRASGEVLLQRYVARAREGRRHPRHDDLNRIEEFRAVFANPARHEDALVFPRRALVVDTARELPMDDVLRHLDPENAVFRPRSAQSASRTDVTNAARALGGLDGSTGHGATVHGP